MPPKLDNKVIARFRDGTIVRGTTFDFAPTKAFLHIDDGRGTRKLRNYLSCRLSSSEL